MSRPIGSACCDDTVTNKEGSYDLFNCDYCGKECEVIV
jgi:hypothetical protein